MKHKTFAWNQPFRNFIKVNLILAFLLPIVDQLALFLLPNIPSILFDAELSIVGVCASLISFLSSFVVWAFRTYHWRVMALLEFLFSCVIYYIFYNLLYSVLGSHMNVTVFVYGILRAATSCFLIPLLYYGYRNSYDVQ